MPSSRAVLLPMDADTAMEMEIGDGSLSHSSSKRLGIKNTIQTNFGDDYVFQIASRYLHLSPPLMESVRISEDLSWTQSVLFVNVIDVNHMNG